MIDKYQSNFNRGILTISLDFELYWGMRDEISIEEYRDHLAGVYQAVPKILNLFKQYQIHATWATVGFLHFTNFEELKNNLPKQLPSYKNPNLSPYQYIDRLTTEDNVNLHFCPELINLIKQYPGQEIGTHSFSHYYCLEEGQTQAEFAADLTSAIATAKRHNLITKSLVFPRNQYNTTYLGTLKDLGITCYRGNEQHPIYNSHQGDGNSLSKRILRLIDSYLNLSGYNCYSLEELPQTYPVNIPSSRFLRPYSPKLKFLEPLRFNRIKTCLSYAAQKGLVYHLWWHPHNFGVNLSENLEFLHNILEIYRELHQKYDMKSLNMSEVSELFPTDAYALN